MKSLKLTALTTLLLLALTSCMQELSPSVAFNNVSTQRIYNIRGIWNHYYLSGENRLAPGGGASQNFAIDDKSDFFGPVHLEWENAAGKKFIKDFVFKKEELPTYLLMEWQQRRIREKHEKEGGNILGDKTYARVEFYFDQDGVVYYTSDHPEIEQITKKYHDLEEKSAEEFRKNPCWKMNPPSAMIWNREGRMLQNPSYEKELLEYNKKCGKYR